MAVKKTRFTGFICYNGYEMVENFVFRDQGGIVTLFKLNVDSLLICVILRVQNQFKDCFVINLLKFFSFR